MAEAKATKKDAGSNDGLALIIGGLFVLALVFATYSYFNRSSVSDKDVKGGSTQTTDENESTSLGDRLRELFSGDKGEDTDMAGTGGPIDMQIDDSSTDTKTSVFSQWVATDYQQGDITGSSYTVKSGDTLWEIAEAKYGNGAEWTKILQANSSDIGYLPNGSQALIVPGQTLVLP